MIWIRSITSWQAALKLTKWNKINAIVLYLDSETPNRVAAIVEKEKYTLSFKHCFKPL